MGLFGSKKKNDAGKSAAAPGRKPITESSPSTRKSVRRVVPAAKPASTGQGSSGKRVLVNPTPRLDAETGLEDIHLPGINSDPEQLELGSSPQPMIADITPNRTGGSQPIRVSAAPDFAGSLVAPRNQGPSRTGDQVLLEFLTGKAGLLTAEQANAVRSKAEGTSIAIDEAAVSLAFLTEEQLVNSLSQETWVPHLKVDKYEIRKKALDTITRDDAQHFGVFPVDKLGNLLTLAMVNPLDAEAIRQLEAKTGLDIKKVVATRSEVATAIDKYYGGKVIASEGSRSFSQDVPANPKSATQMLSRGVEPSVASDPLALPSFEGEPTPSSAAMITPPAPGNVAADIQDIDDLLGGEETIAPAILEPVSIRPEESNDALELTDAPITQAIHRDNELEFAQLDAPKGNLDPLSRGSQEDARLDLEKTDAIAPPAPRLAKPAARPMTGRGELRTATARIAAGNAGTKVVNLVPVLEEEFRYAISHGKSKVFERWVALQSRNRIVNAVTVEKELDGVLGGLYAQVRN